MAQTTLTRTQIIVEPGKQDITTKATFDAPIDQVFKVYTDPRLIPKWWGPERFMTKVDRMDVRLGGSWRYIQRDEQGKEYAFRGIYHEVVKNQRIISTFQWEEMPGHVILDTITFKDIDSDMTEVTVHSVFQSVEDRDGMYNMGMEEGARESNERFAKLVEK
jgi:uncharacterized protein YndB with AHSA1/START domain